MREMRPTMCFCVNFQDQRVGLMSMPRGGPRRIMNLCLFSACLLRKLEICLDGRRQKQARGSARPLFNFFNHFLLAMPNTQGGVWEKDSLRLSVPVHTLINPLGLPSPFAVIEQG